MDNAGGILALVSTVISSVALTGVMVGLLLQARQVRIANVQIYRASHAELVRLSLEYPEARADPADSPFFDTESLQRTILINWQFQHLRLGYSIGALSEDGLRHVLSQLLASSVRREWWEWSRKGYEYEATSRRSRRFIKIANAEYARAEANVKSAQTSSEGSS